MSGMISHSLRKAFRWRTQNELVKSMGLSLFDGHKHHLQASNIHILLLFFIAMSTMRENPHLLFAHSYAHSGTSLRWPSLKLLLMQASQDCHVFLGCKNLLHPGLRVLPHHYLCTSYLELSLASCLFTRMALCPAWVFVHGCSLYNVESSTPWPSFTTEPSLVALWKLITLCILVMIKFDWYVPTPLLNNKFSLLVTFLIGKNYIMFWK